MSPTPQPDLASDHVGETVEQLGKLYEAHRRNTSAVQRFANRLTATLGRPIALVIIATLVTAWIVGNYVARSTRGSALEEFPFPDLGFILTLAALVVALLILTTQRHQDDLAEKRARLTLQIAALSEKKIAKLIDLVEEQRRDNPLLPGRTDLIADAMAKPVDASSGLGSGLSSGLDG